jgi:hypothetical protein
MMGVSIFICCAKIFLGRRHLWESLNQFYPRDILIVCFHAWGVYFFKCGGTLTLTMAYSK